MASLADLPGAAQSILEAYASQLAAQGVVLPERQFVAAGSDLVWDGEQLSVNLVSIAQGQPGAGWGGGYFPPSAVQYHASWVINLVRVTSALNVDAPFAEGMVPSAEQLNAAGANAVSDAQAMIMATSAIAVGYMVTGPGETFVMSALQTVGPEGGMAATRLLLEIALA